MVVEIKLLRHLVLKIPHRFIFIYGQTSIDFGHLNFKRGSKNESKSVLK